MCLKCLYKSVFTYHSAVQCFEAFKVFVSYTLALAPRRCLEHFTHRTSNAQISPQTPLSLHSLSHITRGYGEGLYQDSSAAHTRHDIR